MKNIITLLIVLAVVFISYNFYKNSKKTETTTTQKKTTIESKTISWTEFQDKATQENTTVIDVRTQSEILGGKLFDETLEIDYYGSDFEQKVSELDPEQTYLIYCRSGNRSGKSIPIFEKYGLKVYDLGGGYSGAK